VIDLGRLPYKTLRAGTRLYRIHRRAFGPWYFDGSGDGRFDPVATRDRGACYWAEDPHGAWVEVFRTRMLLTPDDVDDRRLSVLTLRGSLRVPDLTSRRALTAGVTAALTAGAEYGPAHELADALQGREEGVRWRLRHDLEQQLIGIALFGQEGAASPSARRALPPTRSTRITGRLINDARREFGYEILTPPVS
jgi:hypothetical protein